MRSMVLLSVMVVVALAAGLSFVLRAGAETNGGSTPLMAGAATLGDCRGFTQADSAATALPATGAGPDGGGSLKAALFALGLGALVLLMGGTLRRHPRRRAADGVIRPPTADL